ncbi:hypothetical protein HYU23_03365 [Candidatus Woesearchaeota archaeon]|nr:hypothetical protein [Candidatus Woesearchaeota archaeon]
MKRGIILVLILLFSAVSVFADMILYQPPPQQYPSQAAQVGYQGYGSCGSASKGWGCSFSGDYCFNSNTNVKYSCNKGYRCIVENDDVACVEATRKGSCPETGGGLVKAICACHNSFSCQGRDENDLCTDNFDYINYSDTCALGYTCANDNNNYGGCQAIDRDFLYTETCGSVVDGWKCETVSNSCINPQTNPTSQHYCNTGYTCLSNNDIGKVSCAKISYNFAGKCGSVAEWIQSHNPEKCSHAFLGQGIDEERYCAKGYYVGLDPVQKNVVGCYIRKPVDSTCSQNYECESNKCFNKKCAACVDDSGCAIGFSCAKKTGKCLNVTQLISTTENLVNEIKQNFGSLSISGFPVVDKKLCPYNNTILNVKDTQSPSLLGSRPTSPFTASAYDYSLCYGSAFLVSGPICPASAPNIEVKQMSTFSINSLFELNLNSSNNRIYTYCLLLPKTNLKECDQDQKNLIFKLTGGNDAYISGIETAGINPVCYDDLNCTFKESCPSDTACVLGLESSAAATGGTYLGLACSPTYKNPISFVYDLNQFVNDPFGKRVTSTLYTTPRAKACCKISEKMPVAPPLAPPVVCQKNEDCGVPGFICSNNKCEEDQIVKTLDPLSSGTSACFSANQNKQVTGVSVCKSGYYCNEEKNIPYSCNIKKDSGKTCKANFECLSSKCDGGFCTKPAVKPGVIASKAKSCTELGGTVCNGICRNNDYIKDARELNCCSGKSTCEGLPQYVPTLGSAIRFDKTCLGNGIAQIKVVYADGGNEVEQDNLAKLGVSSSTYTEQDYSCGGLQISPKEGQSVPGYGLTALLLSFVVLIGYYFFRGNRKLLKH